MSRLIVNPNVLLSPVAAGYVAFDVVDERLYELNPLAALIVELCDGSRSPDEIAEIVGPLGPSGTTEAIYRWLADAVEAGLFTVHLAAPGECSDLVRELGADDLARLAACLRDDGKTQAAFLCQQRAVELCPKSAQLLCDLGELAHIVGNREAAGDAYQRYLVLNPGDAEIEHLLTSLRDEPAPPRVPDACIKQLYQRFSTFYDLSMCEELGYEGPRQLFEVIQRSIGGRSGLSVLDLGCGTGLAGQVLRPLAARLVGVDLSAEMISHARMRNIYDELLVGELTEWLEADRQKFDLIVACDTLIYFGDLRQVIGPATKRLSPRGTIAFSVERARQSPFRLTDSGRYEHHLDHIREVAGAFQMSIIDHRERFLRMEYGREVVGHFVCLGQPAPSGAEPRQRDADEGLPVAADRSPKRGHFMKALTSLILVIIAAQADDALAQAGRQPAAAPTTRAEPAAADMIDTPVLAKLSALGIRPASRCPDGVFVRRVYLDVIGTLPTAEEAKVFLADRSPRKRALLVDRLLERPEFADYWAMKWCDLLRVKSEVPINLWPNAVQAYHRWVRDALKQNKPYDQFVREMLTASGSNFREPPVNFYRAVRDRQPETIAQAVTLTFMGTRTEGWPKERLAGMAAFFANIQYKKTTEWKEEIVQVDQLGGTAREAVLPDGTRVAIAAGADGRAVFADWLIRPENPWFARNIVNRVWYWLLGVGIVHEPDDIRPDNPPSNPELLAALERELVASRYDLRHLYRLILNSATYQRSCIPTTDRPEAERLFAHYPMRRLDAEVLIDAICQITGTTETYTSLIPEPWTYIPKQTRSIALADASITSSFLDLFGRPARDTGLELERNNAPTAAQRLHLLNSSHIQRKLAESAKLRALTQSRSPVDDLYLTILSRYPTDNERKIVVGHKPTGAGNAELVLDLAWVLLNTAEFQYRH